MGFGYHLVGGDVEHGSTSKAQHDGKQGGGHGTEAIANENSYNLKQSYRQGYNKGTCVRYTCQQQGGNDYHALGNVVEGYAKGYCPRCDLVAVHADAGGNAFGKLVYGNGHNEEHDAVQRGIVAVLLGVQTCDGVHVRRNKVNDVEEESPCHHTYHYSPPRHTLACSFEGRHYQPYRGCRQHNAGTIAQDGIVPLVWQFLYEEAENGTQHGGSAKPGCANQ